MKEVVVHRILRVASVALVSVLATTGLGGCAGTASPGANCINPLGSSPANSVSASGTVGNPPAVDFPTNLVGRNASTSTLAAGDGPVIVDGDYVDFEATVYAGTDRAVLTQTAYGASGSAPQRMEVGAAGNALGQSFLCHRVGERFALVATVKDVFGDVGQSDIKPTDTIVLVIDAVAAYPHSASGTPGWPVDGLPAVTTDPDGRPGIARPATTAPTSLLSETLVQGNGRKVQGGDAVVVNYLGVLWDGTVFDSTYDKGQPATLVAQSFVTHNGFGVVPGLAKALLGQRVGSRVVVAIPPGEGYPQGQAPQSIPDGSTMIFVVDILGIQR